MIVSLIVTLLIPFGLKEITYRSKDFRATVAIALSFFLSKDNLAALCLINGVMRLVAQH